MNKKLHLFLFLVFFSCNSDPSVVDEETGFTGREQEMYEQLEKQGVQLSEEEIEKLEKIEEIAKKYNVDVPEEYGPEFAESIDIWLNMSPEAAFDTGLFGRGS